MLNGVFVCPRRDVFMFARCIAYITSPHTSHLVRSSELCKIRSDLRQVYSDTGTHTRSGSVPSQICDLLSRHLTSPIFARFMMLCCLSYFDSFHVQHPTVLSPTPSWYFSYHSLEHLNFSQPALKYYSKYINKEKQLLQYDSLTLQNVSRLCLTIRQAICPVDLDLFRAFGLLLGSVEGLHPADIQQKEEWKM